MIKLSDVPPPGAADPAWLPQPRGAPPSCPRDVVAALRQRIHAIERGRPDLEAGAHASGPRWCTGAEAIDPMLGPTGLENTGVHELRPAFGCGETQRAADWAAAWAAVQAFALMLAARRVRSAPGRILWCASATLLREAGSPYGPGLGALGVSPESLLLVVPGRAQDALWSIEEGLKSQALSLVVGVVAQVELTPARRLALAAAHHHTPCLLLTDPRHPPAAATATRWSIAPAASGPHPLVPRAPGAPRLRLTLERNRISPVSSSRTIEVEWCHEAYRFRMAAGLAPRSSAAQPSWRRAG